MGEATGLRDPLASPSPYYVLIEAAASGRADLRSMADGFLEMALEAGAVTDGAVAASDAQAASFWRIREAMVEAEFRYGRHLRTDVSVPISSIASFLAEADARLGDLAPGAILLPYGHIGDGNIHYNVLPPRTLESRDLPGYLHACEEAIFDVVDRCGGSISAEHGIGLEKRAAFAARTSLLQVDLLRRVESAFDPNDLLNPGRLLL